MATIYCSKSGNDGNNGSTYLLSKLTIQAGITAAGSNGIVIVGSGLYNEKLTIPVAYVSPIIYCDGIVILDGTSIANNPAITFYASSYTTLTISPYTSGGSFVVQNHICTTNLIDFYFGYGSIAMNNVSLISNSTPTGIATNNGGGNSQNCIFSGFSSSVLNVQLPTILNCTFYNCGTALYNITLPGCSIVACIFSNVTTAWNLMSGSVSSNQNLYYGITNWKVGATTYTSQATLQAAGYDLNSLWQNPNFVDPTNNVFYLTSNPNTTNNQLLYYGAYPYNSITRGSNYNPDSTWNITATAVNTGWWNPDGNITLVSNNFQLTTATYIFVVSGITTTPLAGATYTNNGITFTILTTNLFGSSGSIFGTISCSASGLPTNTGNLTKSGGTGDGTIAYSNIIWGGQLWSPVWDLGTSRTISQSNIAAIQSWPTNMVDATKTDTLPNKQTSEIRVNGTSFNQNDATIAWTEVKNNINFVTQGGTLLTGRFVQLKLTLRQDDVAS